MAKDSFVKVRDASRRPIRGLYKRGPSLYARIAINRKVKWVKLDAANIDDAKVERLGISKNGIPKKATTPTFENFSKRYISIIGKMKKPSTVKGEEDQLNILNPHFGKMKLDEIFPTHIEEFRVTRLKKVSPNTVNHNIVVLRNVFKKAKTILGLHTNPFEGIVQLRFDRKPKRFVPLNTIKEAADWILNNIRCSEIIAEAILFLAYTGARWREGMSVRWEDIDWNAEQVCIGALGAKSRTFRYVPFHGDLKNHLFSMRSRIGSENCTGWLFPSYRTPEEKDPWPLKDISEALSKARIALKQVHWTPHDLRHHYASRCVMAGIDFKTIAEWLGHKDGGMLVTTTYGHLAPGHGKLQASKLEATTEIVKINHSSS
jgi:integrase